MSAPTRTRTSVEPIAGRTVVVLHAHPDDEAIFTAAAMHRLARQGARVVLVTATAGELGPVLRPLAPGQTLADRRRQELEAACEILGVARLVLLGHRDSGMAGWDANHHPRALAAASTQRVARTLADLCVREGAEALVHYDPNGIYGHPDHLAVHRVGAAAARHAQITGYEATVDRRRPRTRRPHLVDRAAGDREPGDQVGSRPETITTLVTATTADLRAKRRAMAAHATQVPRDATRRPGFAAAYGREWFRRVGPAGLLDSIS